MRSLSTILFVLIGLAVPAALSAHTIQVPSQYGTIQAGIDAAVTGDSVVVADGHYYERISFRQKTITVGSQYLIDGLTNHIAATIIDADPSVLGVADTGSVVRIIAVQTGAAKLKGLTLQKGTGTPLAGMTGLKGGGGIFCSFTNAVIDHCVVQNCTADLGSGLIAFQGSMIQVATCSISGSSTTTDFSFLEARDSCVLGAGEARTTGFLGIEGSTIGSIATGSSGRVQLTGTSVTGTITMRDTCNLEVYDCRIAGLTSIRNETYATFTKSTVAGVSADTAYAFDAATLDTCLVTGPSRAQDADIAFSHCTILKPITCADGTIRMDSTIVSVNGGKILYCADTVMAAVDAYCCDFYGYDGPDWFDCNNIFLSTDNIISANPRFCNAAAGDYRIADTSACAPRNNACNALMGAYGIGCSCCTGSTGNVNMTGIVDLSDLSALVSFLTGGGFVLPCRAEANINGVSIVDLSDLSALVNFLTGGGYALPVCY